MMGYMKLSIILTERLHALSAAYTAHPGKSEGRR